MNGAMQKRVESGVGREIRRQRDSHRQIFCPIHRPELVHVLLGGPLE